MDFIIKNELATYPELGLACLPFTRDTSEIYGDDYFERYRFYEVHHEHHQRTVNINSFRKSLVDKHVKGEVIDVGCGSGTFIKMRDLNATCPQRTWGYDINPRTIEWLKTNKRFCDPYKEEVGSIEAITMWDCLEHMEEPSKLLSRVAPGGHVFITVPLFENLDSNEIRKSKHYKPNEHYWYFTVEGLKSLFRGFEMISHSSEEVSLGREQVGTFVFRKNK